LDDINHLVPQNNIVSSSDIIPGLESTNEVKETFPLPNPKKKDIEKMKANKHPTKNLYIHNLEI